MGPQPSGRPLGRFAWRAATILAVAATILFLASPGNAVTRGAVVPVYGKS